MSNTKYVGINFCCVRNLLTKHKHTTWLMVAGDLNAIENWQNL